MTKDIKEIKDLVQDAINKGATTVEDVHKRIANLPMDVLAQIGPLAQPMGQAKEFSNRTIGSVYDLIRNVNDTVGKYAEELLDKAKGATKPKKKA